ncbi:hypothetical protein HZZ00_37480 (plasmid) [Streptomyces sp. NEAU-sy36]|uniref:hypothetical protein n=1 Tax=unclassified Streptomyces TaxID=2593676 RepID=UPI0015D58B76|nr:MULTISPECIES: hypothetical protein [unclassified Streptomyces]QLJ06729.1 hypothetical protein HZZ00_37480 [Streptomyces sp. NEAU-sy36]
MGFVTGLKKVVIDGWSWLNYKPIYSDPRGMPNRRAFPEAQASWVPAEDERRLAAYKLLTAYDNNQAAELAAILDGEQARERREFGDPAMFVETVMAHVLGREQHITVPGAEGDTAQPTPDEEIAGRVQDLLRAWADDELLPMRIQQAERKAVALGDGIYRMAWDPAKQRPTIRAVDPGFYFPVIGEDDDGGEFPQRVHFAWELPEDPKNGLKPRLRRITYEIAPIGAATSTGVDGAGRALRVPVTTEGSDGQTVPVIARGDTLTGDGTITRQYAWNDAPTPLTCYLTDATWDLGDLKAGHDVDDLPLDKATYATRSDGEVLDHLDLYIDFIPVIHVPNTVPAAEEHWGQSSLAKVLQVFDELQAADTDSARASATTGLPMIGISGAVADARQAYDVGPGAVFKLGENGRLTTIDTSPALRELRAHKNDLADRAATNARLPAVSLGTLDPSKVASGYAMELSLGPLDSLVASMRLARAHKYALLLKFAQRLFLAGQHPDWTGITPQPAELVFGPYTPTDTSGVLNQVTNGVSQGVLSLETGVRMLQEAGFPIEDVQQEIERIQSRQFEQARTLADATGNPDAVAAFLGQDTTVTPSAPAPQLPSTPADAVSSTTAGGSSQGSGGNTA